MREPATIPKLVHVSTTYLRRETMMNFIKNFRKDEAGAVTVDWVVLTAAVVGLAVAAYTQIETSTTTLINAAADRVDTENTLAAD
ncbi:hypothetical protein GCM10022290_22570 [Sagittula marina]